MQLDWAGIATLLGAVGSFLGVCVGLFIQIMNWRDQRKMRLEQATHKELLCNISSDVAAIKKADT